MDKIREAFLEFSIYGGSLLPYKKRLYYNGRDEGEN